MGESSAFLVLAHGDPRPVMRLLGALERLGGSTFLHYDARSPRRSRAAIVSAYPEVNLVDPLRCHWGDFSLVRAAIRLIEAAGQRSTAERFTMLSGDSYPTMGRARHLQWVAERAGQQVLDSTRLPHPKWDNGGLDRIEYLRVMRDGKAARLLRLNGAVRTTQNVVGYRRRPPVPVHGGSQYWSLTRPCALWCANSTAALKAQRFFKRTAIPDELYFQTLVENSPWRHEIAREFMVYVDYAYSPSFVLTRDDFDRIRSSGKPFARKLRVPESNDLYRLLEPQL